MLGRKLGHYTVVEKLGEGGMGVVYKAADTRLGRFVALKVLRPERALGEARGLPQEARAASALNHPNIVTIYDILRDGGVECIVMEHVSGKTLDQVIGSGGLLLRQVFKYAVEIADALACAQTAGVVHRDLKPGNIMISERGSVKILDFGLAKLTEKLLAPDTQATQTLTARTQKGTILGTPSYMSPEQAEGRAVDARSDIFSFGAVLYEMLTGCRAFQGPSPISTLAAVLREEPVPVRQLVPDIPQEAARVVGRCLKKDPGHRYQNASELKLELEELLSAYSSPARSVVPESALPSQVRAIAVLPFVDLSPGKDQEYFCDGIAEEILNRLARLEGLRVVSRTSAFRFKGRAEDVRDIGRQLRVSTVLEGSVRKAGDRLRVSAELISVSDGYHLWSERYDRTMDDVFTIQDEISQAIVNTLQLKLGVQRAAVAARRTSLPAYSHYLKGRHCWNQRTEEALRRGLEHFQKAIDEDPCHAPAYAGLADCFVMLGMQGFLPPSECMPRAKTAAQRALEIDPTVAEAHASLGSVRAIYDWDWAGARSAFERAFELNPGYATALHWSAFFCHVPNGHLEAALTQIRKAQDLDPLSLPIAADIAMVLVFQREYAQAIAQLASVRDLDPAFYRIPWYLGRSHTGLRNWDQALPNLLEARALSRGDARVEAALGHAYALAGQRAEAREILNGLIASSTRRYVEPANIAAVYAGLEQPDCALEWLEKALEHRSGWHIFLRVDPFWDTLRADPRFTACLKRLESGRSAVP